MTTLAPERVEAARGGKPHVVVVGGGLAGISAALDCADAGARVTLLERRSRLGGLTWSFEYKDRWIDNGQHVFLRCCEDYLSFLDRIGASDDVHLQERMDISVLKAGAGPSPKLQMGRLVRNELPAPLHLGASLLRYPHLRPDERLRLGQAVLPLRHIPLGDPALDEETFGSWLARHGQTPAMIAAVWDLICVATVNLPAAEASLAMGAKVFQTGLLTDHTAADIGWSAVPLGRLHGERGATALADAGVDVRLGVRVLGVESTENWESDGEKVDRYAVTLVGRESIGADAVVVALPHSSINEVLPPHVVPYQDQLRDLGTSAIVDIHLTYDKPVLDRPLLAALNSPVQWIFDRTESSGLGGRTADGSVDYSQGQYVAVSLSAADDLVGQHPDLLARTIADELARILPAARSARLVDTLVTKERAATFRAVPGTAALRPPAATGLPGLAVAGAWTDTGWPATMEGAVRSGHNAASAVLASLRALAHRDLRFREVA